MLGGETRAGGGKGKDIILSCTCLMPVPFVRSKTNLWGEWEVKEYFRALMKGREGLELFLRAILRFWWHPFESWGRRECSREAKESNWQIETWWHVKTSCVYWEWLIGVEKRWWREDLMDDFRVHPQAPEQGRSTHGTLLRDAESGPASGYYQRHILHRNIKAFK